MHQSSTTRLEQALLYAAQLHRQQKRKGTDTPYLVHLLGVASIVGDYGGDEDQLIAALLHDGPEDQGGQDTLEEIRQRFGDRVARMVQDCSDCMGGEPKPPWLERKQQYIAHVKAALLESRLISAADKLHNARALLRDLKQRGPSMWSRFNATPAQTLWYYRELTQAFLTGGPRELAEELDRVVRELEALSGSRTT